MAKSLIELVKKTGQALTTWQTESDAVLFESQVDVSQFSKPDEIIQKLLNNMDSLDLASLAKQKPHEYFSLPENAVQFCRKDKRVIVYADLIVSEFREAEKRLYTEVIPARIRAYPTEKELMLRAKKYGEQNEYRKDKNHIVAGQPVSHEYWSTALAARFGNYDSALEKAKQRIQSIADGLKDNPSFLIHQGGYELFEYWTIDYDDVKRFKGIYTKLKNTPSLILTKVID